MAYQSIPGVPGWCLFLRHYCFFLYIFAFRRYEVVPFSHFNHFTWLILIFVAAQHNWRSALPSLPLLTNLPILDKSDDSLATSIIYHSKSVQSHLASFFIWNRLLFTACNLIFVLKYMYIYIYIYIYIYMVLCAGCKTSSCSSLGHLWNVWYAI